MLAILLAVGLISCNDSEDLCPVEDSMLVFSSEQEYNNEILKVNNMSLDNLIAYENGKGYSSFGKECLQFYKNIDFEGFKSIKELNNFVEKNSKYLELVEDDDGELSLVKKFENRADRFFLNQNHLYQIGDVIYKAVEKGTVKAGLEDAHVFYDVRDDIGFYKQDDRFIFNDDQEVEDTPSLKSSQICGTYASGSKEDGIQRLLTYISVNNSGSTKVICKFSAKAQKQSWLGYWYNIDRHFWCNVNVNFAYYDNYYGNGWQSGSLSYSVSDQVRETLYDSEIKNGEDIVGSGGYEPGFTSYNVYVDTDAVPSISFSCN